MTPYVLYGNRASGHSYKVALTLRLLGVEYEYRDVDLGLARRDRRSDWREAARFGEVPVLVGPDGPLDQSNAILLKLARTHPRETWDRRFDEVTVWLFWEANRIGYSLPNYRVGLREHGPDHLLVRTLRDRLLLDLDVLEDALDPAPFLLGDRISVADIACAAYLLMEDNPVALEDRPAISAWLERLRAEPGAAPPSVLMPAHGDDGPDRT